MDTWHRLVRIAVVGALGLGVVVIGGSGKLAQTRAAIPKGAVAPAAAPTTTVGRVRRVLIVSEDGMRPDLITQQPMPWHERLAREGSYTWHARTIRHSDTLPSHASMLSGVDVNLHGLSWNSWRPARGFIHVPTIFTEAGARGLKTAAFVGKFKLRHILPEGAVGVFERPGYYCKKVSEEAARFLVAEKPDLAFVHFSDPDEAGHSTGWLSESYKRAGVASDRCLGTLYQALERSGLLEETLLIVSADHGGHNHGHSGALSCDREIPWIARGPRVRRDYNIHSPISTMDTAATALRALNLPLPAKLAGKPITEIFL